MAIRVKVGENPDGFWRNMVKSVVFVTLLLDEGLLMILWHKN
jgi:hypothetical protein